MSRIYTFSAHGRAQFYTGCTTTTIVYCCTVVYCKANFVRWLDAIVMAYAPKHVKPTNLATGLAVPGNYDSLQAHEYTDIQTFVDSSIAWNNNFDINGLSCGVWTVILLILSPLSKVLSLFVHITRSSDSKVVNWPLVLAQHNTKGLDKPSKMTSVMHVWKFLADLK